MAKYYKKINKMRKLLFSKIHILLELPRIVNENPKRVSSLRVPFGELNRFVGSRFDKGLSAWFRNGFPFLKGLPIRSPAGSFQIFNLWFVERGFPHG